MCSVDANNLYFRFVIIKLPYLGKLYFCALIWLHIPLFQGVSGAVKTGREGVCCRRLGGNPPNPLSKELGPKAFRPQPFTFRRLFEFFTAPEPANFDGSQPFTAPVLKRNGANAEIRFCAQLYP